MKMIMNGQMSCVNGAHLRISLVFQLLWGLKNSLLPHLVPNDMSTINISVGSTVGPLM